MQLPVALGQADITFSASLQLYRTDSEEIAAECATRLGDAL